MWNSTWTTVWWRSEGRTGRWRRWCLKVPEFSLLMFSSLALVSSPSSSQPSLLPSERFGTYSQSPEGQSYSRSPVPISKSQSVLWITTQNAAFSFTPSWIWSLGVKPNSEFLRESRIQLDSRNFVIVDKVSWSSSLWTRFRLSWFKVLHTQLLECKRNNVR